ncbi:MAG: hypothetical protein A2020_16425 [Lentisphaerae bacterium GWF2_45_14]|nr:MAG: hypothetical protein A2020_16425 [Lentisphaerae bacterium GWF2_45_14]
MTLVQLKADLAAVEAKMREIVQTGQEVTINGAFTVKNTELGVLEREASRLRRRIYRYNGYSGRTAPDFSG